MQSAYIILVQSAKCLQNRYSNTIVWSTYPGVSEKDETPLYFCSLGQPVPIPPYAMYICSVQHPEMFLQFHIDYLEVNSIYGSQTKGFIKSAPMALMANIFVSVGKTLP